MEIRHETVDMQLTPKLAQILQTHRDEDAFDARYYISRKVKLLKQYCEEFEIENLVVAVSGGIDSSVVLGIASRAVVDSVYPSNVIAVALPDRKNIGVTGQDEAANHAILACNAFGVEYNEIDVSNTTKELVDSVSLQFGKPAFGKTEWCYGQATPYVRTATYYYLANLLSSKAGRTVILGTTNLSEGAFLGYFGKASDGMVDLQMIADIYKSQVYEVGRVLGVPSEIISREPTGDMYDATPDEVVFGAPYDFVELVARGLDHSVLAAAIIRHSIEDDKVGTWLTNVQSMNRYNRHKYLGGSPAVHLNVRPIYLNAGDEKLSLKVWKFHTY